MSYRCAFLGCGPRATGHADAYKCINNGEIVALCDLNEERLNAFGEKYGVTKRYNKLDEMLNKEKPDVIHCVTDPTLRVPLMTRLSDAGVPAKCEGNKMDARCPLKLVPAFLFTFRWYITKRSLMSTVESISYHYHIFLSSHFINVYMNIWKYTEK